MEGVRLLHSIIEQLSKQEIINSEKIKKIQDSINNQYPHYSSKQKAQRLAAQIHDVIERSLPEYSIEAKKSIRNSLIQNKLSANSLAISFQDIFESSIELVSTEELKTKLPEWLQARTDIENSGIEQFLQSILEIDQIAAKEVAVTSQIAMSEIPQVKQFSAESLPSLNTLSNNKKQLSKKQLIAAIAAFFIMVPVVLWVGRINVASNESNNVNVAENKEETIVRQENELPSYLQYQPINEHALQVWLNERNSKLAEEPYFSTIISVANQYNLHPFLLFAITGQEQGFVPRTHQNAEKIANNPFNVFHSWEEYNTNISDTTQIAARTLVNLSEECPEDTHPIKWINRKYAEDPNWWKGVSTIFEKLENEVR